MMDPSGGQFLEALRSHSAEHHPTEMARRSSSSGLTHQLGGGLRARGVQAGALVVVHLGRATADPRTPAATLPSHGSDTEKEPQEAESG